MTVSSRLRDPRMPTRVRLTSKDTVGLALAVSTVALLIVHGVGRHEPHDGPESPAGHASTGDVDPVAFVDVNLLADEPDGAQRLHQVVLVRDGRVTEVGPKGTVKTPEGALVVEGRGSAYLMAAPAHRGPGGAGWAPVAEGTPADLLLLPSDPRSDASAYANPRGRMVDGSWIPQAPE